MNILRCETFTCILTILTFTSNIRVCVQISEKTPIMSGDFKNFLESLGSMVYKYKKPTRVGSDRQRRDEYSFTTSSAPPPPTQISMRNESIFNTQKAALRDALMMKLVSYYENKYKITDHVSTSDISVRHENNINNANALNEMKRTEHTPIHLKSRGEFEGEVLVI